MKKGSVEQGVNQGNANRASQLVRNCPTNEDAGWASIAKGLGDACELSVFGPVGESEIPELPPWAKNICGQLRLTIFKRLLELEPVKGNLDWKELGRLMGACQRHLGISAEAAPELVKVKSPVKWQINEPGAGTSVPVTINDCRRQMRKTFDELFRAGLARSPQKQKEFLCGLAEGYEVFMDAQGQFSGDRGRTAVYLELLGRWVDIEEMRRADPPPTCLDFYQRIASALGDPRQQRFDWFVDVCNEIGLGLRKRGRPRKSRQK
jgi:hypothetical protein